MENLLKVDNIHFSYFQNGVEDKILKDLSFELEIGKLGSLIGPSGCGKSTLLRLLSGLSECSAGSIHFGGENITKLAPDKRRIGLVFQDYALFPHLSVKENILIGINKVAFDNIYFDKLIEMVKIKDLLQMYPHQLSGGQQQRVAIIRTLIRSPRLVLLDEPFSGLDSQLKEEMANEMRLLFKELKMTAILVTHDQNEAFSFSDYVGVMDKGEIIQWDNSYDIYHNPKKKFVANFVGVTSFVKAFKRESNIYDSAFGTINYINKEELSEIELVIRPEHIHLNLDMPYNYSLVGPFQGVIVERKFKGNQNVYVLKLSSGELIKVQSRGDVIYQENEIVNYAIDLKLVNILE
jgi:iron(III) transport system ATP-binding protein